MAQAMLATEHLPRALQTLIVQKAEGNPFFVEEVVKSLQEVGAIRRAGDDYVLSKPLEEIVVPDTIQDVLMARIDRLEETSKKTLQLASVIGREFSYRLLERLADIRERTEAYLQELKAIELIYEKHLFPELVYMFKHALTQDVAYNSLLIQRRQELHGLIGQAIEELYADRLTEQYEVLAYHFAQGEQWAKALEYLCKAADKAAQTFANREALALYDQALEAADHLGQAVNVQTMMAIHQAKADLFSVEALAQLGWASMRAHDMDRALAYAHRAIEAAKEVDAKPVLARGHFVTGFIHTAAARLNQAVKEVDQVLNIVESTSDVFHQSLALYLGGLLKSFEGEYAEASRFQTRALLIAREQNLFLPLLHTHFGYGITLTSKGDYDEALATFEEGLKLSEKVGDEAMRYRLLNSLGWLYIELGDLDRAIDLNKQAAERARMRDNPDTIANAEINLADAFLAKGDLTLAQEFLDGVYHMVKDPSTNQWMQWRYSTRLFASLGELWLARGDLAKAQEFADQCLDIAVRTNSRKNVVKGWRLRGEIALLGKQSEEAEEWLQQALSLAQTVGNPTQLWKTHNSLARLYEKTKRQNLEREQWRAAATIVQSIADGLPDDELRETFINSAPVREIMEHVK
jgi:tetratricopeptide (TPR) repeat protein